MPENSNSKRILKNTGMLYLRMFFIMVVSLYTSRIVLKVLGVEDFGIYNVVGGIVTMFAFLNSSFNTATQRFLNYEMGKNNEKKLVDVFSMSFWSFAILAVVILVLAETAGLWFVNAKLNINPDRMQIANWVYHFSVAAFVVNLLIIPYHATIIAHENMAVYAYVSIGEVLLKLAIVFLISYITIDKLWLFAALNFVATCCVGISYVIYCKITFRECKISFSWNSNLFKKLFSFSGWMMAGSVSNIFSTQGVNILVNMFFCTAMNAARGVAMQVSSAINSFASNFMTAVRPQIVKSYAQGDMAYMNKLAFSASRLVFFLLLFLAIPIIINAYPILDLWLDEVPDYATLFTQLVLIDAIIIAVNSPLAYVNQATGRIRGYQLIISICYCSIFLFTWLLYAFGAPVEYTFYVSIFIDLIGLLLRLWCVKKVVEFPAKEYMKEVIIPLIVFFTISWVVVYGIKSLIVPSSILALLVNVCISFAALLGLIWTLGLNQEEKRVVMSFIGQYIHKNK